LSSQALSEKGVPVPYFRDKVFSIFCANLIESAVSADPQPLFLAKRGPYDDSIHQAFSEDLLFLHPFLLRNLFLN